MQRQWPFSLMPPNSPSPYCGLYSQKVLQDASSEMNCGADAEGCAVVVPPKEREYSNTTSIIELKSMFSVSMLKISLRITGALSFSVVDIAAGFIVRGLVAFAPVLRFVVVFFAIIIT